MDSYRSDQRLRSSRSRLTVAVSTWISVAVGVAVVAAGTLSGMVVADAAVQATSTARVSAQLSGARPVQATTNSQRYANTDTDGEFVGKQPGVCDAPLVYGGQQYCTGYLSWVKSRYYGIGAGSRSPVESPPR